MSACELPDDEGEPLPAVPEPESSGGEDDPQDESPFKKAYLAIDGIEPDEMSDVNQDRLEKQIIEFVMMKCQLPVTNVRLIDKSKTAVMEVDIDDGEGE